MKTLRTIMGKTGRDRITDVNIRDACQITDVTGWIKERRKLWNDVVSRIDDERLVKKIRDNLQRKEERQKIHRTSENETGKLYRIVRRRQIVAS